MEEFTEKDIRMRSLPSRERGLKSLSLQKHTEKPGVAPFAGAWIEMNLDLQMKHSLQVAPFAGAWIEIYTCIPVL